MSCPKIEETLKRDTPGRRVETSTPSLRTRARRLTCQSVTITTILLGLKKLGQKLGTIQGGATVSRCS